MGHQPVRERPVALGLGGVALGVVRDAVEHGDGGTRAALDRRGEADVVEVVVGREHQLDVLQAQALASQAVLERGQGAVVAWTGVDQRQRVPAQEPGVHGADMREGKLDVHDASA